MSDTSESHLVLMRLRPIKGALRPHDWDARKKKVLETAHRVIAESISSDDAYTIHGDDTCMVAFAKTTVAKAEATATEIGDRIVRSLFGEFGVTTFPLQPRVLAIKDLLQTVNSDDSDNLLQGLLAVQGATAAGASNDQKNAMRREAEKAWRRRKLLDMFEPERPAEITHEYRSIWSVDNQRVERFRYVPCLQKSPVERLLNYAVLGPAYAEAELVDLDIQSFENAIIDLKQAIDVGRNVKISLGMHFETVGGNYGRSELMKVLPILPTSIRERLSFTLEGIPDGIPEARLREVVAVLKPFSESRSVIFDPIPTSVRAFRGMLGKVRSVGMDTIHVRLPRDSTHRDIEAMCALVPQINAIGLKTSVFGLSSGDEAFKFATAGCAFLGGRIFGGPFDNIPKPYSIPLSDVEDPKMRSRLPRVISG